MKMFRRTTCTITNVKKIIRSEHIIWANRFIVAMELFSFPNETSPNEFVSRPICAIALCITTVHHVTQKMHVHIRERKYVCNLTLTVGSCVVSKFCATRKLHQNIYASNDLPSLWFGYPQVKRHFSSFEALSTTYVKDTVAKKHGVWEFRQRWPKWKQKQTAW